MAWTDLDPRHGGSCINFLAKKICSYICAYVQMVFWVCSLLTVMFNPSSMGAVVEDNDTVAIAIGVLFMLFSILFSVLLVVGLHKNRRIFIQSYCIYVGVYIVLLIISLIVNIFLQPSRVGFRGFFSTIIVILMHILFFIVVRGYYLLTYCARAVPKEPFQPPV